MGIKDLNKLINELVSSPYSIIDIKELKNKKIAIDGEIILHRHVSSNNKKIHIYNFFNEVIN